MFKDAELCSLSPSQIVQLLAFLVNQHKKLTSLVIQAIKLQDRDKSLGKRQELWNSNSSQPLSTKLTIFTAVRRSQLPTDHSVAPQIWIGLLFLVFCYVMLTSDCSMFCKPFCLVLHGFSIHYTPIFIMLTNIGQSLLQLPSSGHFRQILTR